MSRDEWLWWGAGVAALVIAVLLVVVYVAGRRRARDLEAQVNLLRERLAGLERDAATPASPATEGAPRASEYLITGLGTPEAEPAAPTVDSRLFADLVLRETVVRAASLAHGVRRGLAPEARNRIRFEMRREARRSRKQRRSDLREAQQFLRERARARRDGVQDAG